METKDIKEIYETQLKPAYARNDFVVVARLVIENKGLLDCLNDDEKDAAIIGGHRIFN